jgi:uncharacterized membrane protein YheB (UPF0754 family)
MTSMTLETLIPLAAPPLLGALIGYVTNLIAIRMLFRPLRPWRICGLRVPLTPGIIPAKRGELAEKMGTMVGSHLLTSSDVGRALEKESFQRELKQAVGDKLDGFFDRNLGPLATLVPVDFSQRFRELIELLRWKAIRAVFDYLASDAFAQRLQSYLRDKEDQLLAQDLSGSLSPERFRELRRHFNGQIEDFLRSESLADGVSRFVDQRVEGWLASERPLRDLLPADLVELLLAQLEKELPGLLEKLGGLMHDPDFRARLVTRAQAGIDRFLDSLGGLTGLLAGFIDLKALYAKIPAFLDQAGDEIAQLLKEERTQQQVATLLRARLTALLERPLASYLEQVPYEKVAGVRRFLRDKAVATLQGPKAAAGVRHLFDQGLDRIKDRSFRSLLEAWLPPGRLDDSRQRLHAQILQTLRSPAARRVLEELLAEKLEQWIFQQPLGKLATRIPLDVREELEAGLCTQLVEMLKKEVPPLVETLNVARMVEEKVNGLDILQVEGLLLGIMQEQFKYINLFGALLGGLIGLMNLFLLQLV